MELRKSLFGLNEVETTDWIKEKIKSAQIVGASYIFHLKGKQYCLAAFLAIFGVTKYKFNTALNTLDSPTVCKARIDHSTEPESHTFLHSYFSNLVACFCDIMPDSSHNLYLPIYFTKTQMHLDAVQQFIEEKNGSRFSYRVFTDFWKKNRKNVKIPKTKTMGQCDTCLELKNLRQSGASKTEINQTIARHNQLHSSARTMFTQIRDRASQQPFNILYLQFDGKQASYLPHIMPLPKETQCLPRIRTHVYATVNFSSGSTHFYLGFPHWAAGPNLSVTILFDSILQFFKTIKHNRPSQLYLQVDNCAKDGKNRIIFAFAAHLVHWGWFKEVNVVSLIQGHTHDLIDGEFGTWAKGEEKRRIMSLHDVGNFISFTFKKPNKYFSVVCKLYDWTTYFDSVLTEISGHTDARWFQFFKNASNEVVMVYKTNTEEVKFRGLNVEGIDRLHGIQLCTEFNQKAPHPIVPEPLKLEVVSGLANSTAFTTYYNTLDSFFWSSLERDSVAYLSGNLFQNEG